MVPYQGLNRRHFIPAATAVSVLERHVVDRRSTSIFRQDGAPAHRSARAQKWCQEHFHNFWTKDTWPGNSPDLNPIKELGFKSGLKSSLGIMQQEPEKTKASSNLQQLQKDLKRTWARMSPQTLKSLVASMPAQCICHLVSPD